MSRICPKCDWHAMLPRWLPEFRPPWISRAFGVKPKPEEMEWRCPHCGYFVREEVKP